LSQWKEEETHIFQYGLFTFAFEKNMMIEDFTDQDWE
jgi:hypothetical protein